MTPAELQAAVSWFRAQRLAQGKPATVEDPLALAKIAAILREHLADQADAAAAAAAVEQSA
jgi:hypothetical protein